MATTHQKHKSKARCEGTERSKREAILKDENKWLLRESKWTQLTNSTIEMSASVRYREGEMFCRKLTRESSWKRQWSLETFKQELTILPSANRTSAVRCRYHYLPCKEGLLWLSTVAFWAIWKAPEIFPNSKDGNSVKQGFDQLFQAWLLFSFCLPVKR